MLVDHDILWLQTVPAIAAIYYHAFLESTHVLFCPDAQKQLDDLTVRDLGRSILNIVNSNNKKIAVHFMRPCSIRKHQDVLRFLHKMRSELTIKCMVLPTTLIQTSLLTGWATALDEVPQRDLWIRRCLVPYSEEAFRSPTENSEWVTEYSQPFCITDNAFTKRALIVNITLSMCASKGGPGLALDEGAIAAIQGWADVVKQQSLQGALVLIADEKVIFQGITEVPGDVQDTQLQRHRHSTHRFLEKLGTECPIYLYTRDFKSSVSELTMQKIASIQHRHHLWLSGSYVLNWSREESGLERDCPEFFSGMHRFYLADALVQKSRAIWKSDFLEMLQRTSDQLQPDNIKLLSPSTIDTQFSRKDRSLTPLLYHPSDKLTREEAYMGIVRQSVSASNTQVFELWKSQLRHIEAPEPMQSEDKQSQPPEDLMMDEDAIASLRYSFADRVDDETVAKYIGNIGAYKRGESILDKMDGMRMTGNTDSIDIWAKAHGTAADAYTVSITIASKSRKEVEFRDGQCSCPVGKKGKCKHCTALLLRFMVNTDEFQYVLRSQRLQPSTEKSIPKDKSSTTPDENLPSGTLARQPSSTPVESPKDFGMDQLSIIEPRSSVETKTPPKEERHPSPEVQRPKVARVLPWQRAPANEGAKSTKKRVTKKSSGETKKSTKRKREESDEEEMFDAAKTRAEKPTKKKNKESNQEISNIQPIGTRAKKPRASSSRKKTIKEESEEDDFEIDPKKLASKRTVTRRTKPIISNKGDDDGSEVKHRKSVPQKTAAKSKVAVEASEDEDDDGFEIKARTSIPRKASTQSKLAIEVSEDENGDEARHMEESSPSPVRYGPPISSSIVHGSQPRETHSQQREEDDDSDATDDGLGVVYRAPDTGSQMSVDQSSMAKTSSLSDVETTTLSYDADKTQTYNAVTTDDLFDELGL